MNSIILMTPPSVSLTYFTDKLRENWRITTPMKERASIESKSSRAYLYLDNEFKEIIHEPEMCSESLVEQFDRAKSSIFYFLDYSDRQLAAEILQNTADDPAFIVEDAWGTVLPGHKFVEAIRNRGWP